MPDFDIRKIRLEMGLSQEALARLLEISLGTLRGWEYGQHKPSPMAWEKIKKWLDNQREKGKEMDIKICNGCGDEYEPFQDANSDDGFCPDCHYENKEADE